METNRTDDGSLAFLNIPRDENSRSFNCDTVTQSKLVNTSFWIVDFIENVETRFSKSKGTSGQTLVKIKQDKDAPESEAKKFFTGSADILYILKAIKERNAFPRTGTAGTAGRWTTSVTNFSGSRNSSAKRQRKIFAGRQPP